MSATADVVIVGGGIVGVSTAYYLGRLGVRDVVLLEKGALGEGSTIRCAGIIRGPFSTEVNARFGAESLRIYGSYEDEIGVGISYRKVGYLILTTRPDDLAAMEAVAPMQRAVGLDTRIISAREVAELNPWLRVDDLAGALYTPDGGYASQHEVVMGFARRAREMGLRLEEGLACSRIRVEGDRVRGVDTPAGPIDAPVVVLAAGVWSRPLAASLGVDLPVFASRSHIVMFRPESGLSRPFPVGSDFRGSFYFRPEVDQVLVGMSNPDEEISLRMDVDWDFIHGCLPAVTHRLPFLAEAGIGTTWAGPIEYTPDKHPIMGRVPEVEGLLVSAGFSGHGFMHGPVAGKLMAELIGRGRAETIDIRCLDIRRFDPDPPTGLGPIFERFSYARKAIAEYRRKPVRQGA